MPRGKKKLSIELRDPRKDGISIKMAIDGDKATPNHFALLEHMQHALNDGIEKHLRTST